MKKQKQTILRHLLKYGTITTMECFSRYKITRLSEYIRQLRNDGIIINSNWQGNHEYVVYELVDQPLDLSFISEEKKSNAWTLNQRLMKYIKKTIYIVPKKTKRGNPSKGEKKWYLTI